MFKLLLNFLFLVFLLMPSANSQQWKDTWSSFTNNPIVNKVLGTNIKCNNNENGTPEFFTFILNVPLSTILSTHISRVKIYADNSMCYI